MPKFILNVAFKGLDGSPLSGPVTFSEESGYLFKNTFSDLDLYFYLKKSSQGWYFAGGPQVKIPQEFINSVGSQIDDYLNTL